MAKQERIQKPAVQEREAETPPSSGGEQSDLSETDDLLDEIDAILEENASEVLANFRQQGGQ